MKESDNTVISPIKTANEGFVHFTKKELLEETENFFGEQVVYLSQEQINTQTGELFKKLAKNDIDRFDLFAFILPHQVTNEEIKTGESSWAKVYKALFSIAATNDYKESPELQMIVRGMENIIEQNPQMVGPVAMWDIAKNIMWRKDIPTSVRGGLMRSMTYALAFFDTNQYETELLKNLNFEDAQNYTQSAQMLEALKQFWSVGSNEGYAEDRVPGFYLKALKKIKETPKTNYLLSIRAREILSMLESNEDFPNESIDIKPFELSKDVYASTQVVDGLMIVPQEDNKYLQEAVKNFDSNEQQIKPPQWMVDEAIEQGETWVTWTPPQDLMKKRDILFDQMHSYARYTIDEVLGDFSAGNDDKKPELVFDYEYLISRPVRELIQREFGFAIKDLSIKEQFYFLNYLKHTTVESVETTKLFIANFGIDAMRAFLINQEDKNASENIMITGVMFEESAKPLFRAYAQTLDAGEGFAKQLKASTRSAEVGSLMGEFQEGLLKRAGHLFSASKQMGLSEYDEDHNHEDIVQAFSGVAKMQDVLSRIGQDKGLEIRRDHMREGSKNPLHDAGSETFFYDIDDVQSGEHLSLKVFVRPTANSEGEARINFELSLDSLPEDSELKKAFTQTTAFKDKKKTVTQSVIRFGFDLDSKTNPPAFSFDMGRGAYKGEQMERTGDILGNILQSVAPEGSHMTDFNPRFSDPETFKQIALTFKQYFKNLEVTAKEG